MFRKFLSPTLLFIAVSLISSCGGESGPSGPTTATGQLKDSNVEGVRYVSGEQTGFTGPDGSFIYEVGNTVTFSIGGVTLATVNGKSVIHPVDFVTDGSSANTIVRNIVRFLLMLDTDGNPDNGIQVSAAVRSTAENWTQIDFNTGNLDLAVAAFISDVASANASAPVLPDTNTAIAHMESTFLCAYSGAFVGTFNGSDQGTFGFLIDALNGDVIGVGYSTLDDLGFFIEGSTPIAINSEVDFISGSSSTGATFSGSFPTINTVSGNWQNSPNLSGAFSGVRVGGALNATHRFTGRFDGTDAGLFAFDVDRNGNISGRGYTVFGHVTFALSGSVDINGNLTASIPGESALLISGNLNRSTGSLSGTWSNSPGGGSFSGSGCQLN